MTQAASSRPFPPGSRASSLETLLRELQPGLIAVSGGIDSRVLFCLARRAGLDFQAVFFSGPHLSPREDRECRRLLQEEGGGHRILELDPLQEEAVAANEAQRCYHCKLYLFSRALELGRELGRPRVLDGSQLDDLDEHRPGRAALRELGIHSPLQRAGLDKAEVRALARELGLPDPDQASRPCLFTRFAYGLRPGRSQLARVAEFEDRMREYGLREFRLRVLGREGYVLQIKSAEQELYQRYGAEIGKHLANLGLEPCEVRITSTVSGFFDQD